MAGPHAPVEQIGLRSLAHAGRSQQDQSPWQQGWLRNDCTLCRGPLNPGSAIIRGGHSLNVGAPLRSRCDRNHTPTHLRTHILAFPWPYRAPTSPPRAIVATAWLLHYVGVFRDSQVTKHMLEYSPRRTANPQASVAMGTQQSRRLLLALVLLLTALAAVLIKDRDFWFGGGSSTVDAYVPETSAASQTTAKSVLPSQPAQTHTTKKPVASANPAEQPKTADTPAVTTKRTILPPLDVEVVAGSAHRKLHPGSNATKVEIPSSETPSAPALKAATNAVEHQAVADASQPAYPPLAQHMNVQGAVTLQALIGVDGVIENLRVLSGPAILAAAAQQAVREWRFKPIVQNGQAVESKATITVNFTIKVADNSAQTTLAEMQAADRLIITR